MLRTPDLISYNSAISACALDLLVKVPKPSGHGIAGIGRLQTCASDIFWDHIWGDWSSMDNQAWGLVRSSGVPLQLVAGICFDGWSPKEAASLGSLNQTGAAWMTGVQRFLCLMIIPPLAAWISLDDEYIPDCFTCGNFNRGHHYLQCLGEWDPGERTSFQSEIRVTGGPKILWN